MHIANEDQALPRSREVELFGFQGVEHGELVKVWGDSKQTYTSRVTKLKAPFGAVFNASSSSDSLLTSPVVSTTHVPVPTMGFEPALNKRVQPFGLDGSTLVTARKSILSKNMETMANEPVLRSTWLADDLPAREGLATGSGMISSINDVFLRCRE